MEAENTVVDGDPSDESERKESRLTAFILRVIETVEPNESDVRRNIADLRKANPGLTRSQLAGKWADQVCWRYASEGAATALPGVIPGLGTAAMVGLEAATISTDLVYMLRCMAHMAIGVGIIHERDVGATFHQDFVRVLGLWCGVLNMGKEATVRVATKVAVAQFKRVPAEVFRRINRKVGTTILAKYGAKRGGIAVGRLIPFGVGALVGGVFNLATMKAFKHSAISYFETEDSLLYETGS